MKAETEVVSPTGQSPDRLKFEAAWFAVNKEIQNPKKNAVNPFHKNKYADLETVVESVKGILLDHGFTICQELMARELGGAQYAEVLTAFRHVETGFARHTEVNVPIKDFSPQGGMSAFTYGRRYALLAAFCLATEDDDGNMASANKPETTPEKKAEAASKIGSILGKKS